MRVLLVSANREQLPSPVMPIGVLAVASALREGGRHEVGLVDLCFEHDPHARLREACDRFDPAVVGVGIRNLHTNAYDGTDPLVASYADMVATVRRASQARIVLGGSGYSLQPDRLLDRLGADHGIVGEGERAMRALVDALADHRTPARIVRPNGAAAGAGPVTLGRGPRPFGGDLDLLPRPARELADPRYRAFDGTDAVQTKRGCAFACAYCDYPDLEGRKVRTRDPEAVADEVAALARVPGTTHVFFVDSVFNVPRSHARAVCEALRARGSPLRWVCYLSPAAFDADLAAAMVRAGCEGVEVGADSGTEDGLRRLRKPFAIADVERTRALCREHGLLDCATFVLGALGETPDEVRRTLDFVDRLDPDVAAFVVFMEDREAMAVRRARHRDAILRLLADEAPSRPGWVVPELGIRFGERIHRFLRRAKLRGPSWLHLARARRKSPGAVRAR